MTKEMVYTKNRYDEPIVLAHETYHGRDFYIISFGTFPCAYIDVSNLLNMTREEQKYIENAVDCHGGITYSGSILPSVTDKTGWFIGWDYAHCTDYVGSISFNDFGTAKKWTTLEIMNECKMIIDQLAKIITIINHIILSIDISNLSFIHEVTKRIVPITISPKPSG